MQRRDFLKKTAYAAIPVAGSALIVGCETVNSSEGDGNWSADFEIMSQAAFFEAVTIQTYRAALEGVFINDTNTPSAVIEAANRYSDHHSEHLNLFNTNFEEHEGFEIISLENVLPDARLQALNSYTQVVELALQMEFEAAQFYFSRMNDQLSTRKVRSIFAGIFPMEVAHMVHYKIVLGQNPVVESGLFQSFGTGL